MTLIADGFLAGSLLTLLLPVALLIALVYWYVKFIRKVPETAEGADAATGSAAANPGPAAAAPNPGPAAPHETPRAPGER